MVKKLTPVELEPCLVISKNEILGVFRPFIQRSLVCVKVKTAYKFFLYATFL